MLIETTLPDKEGKKIREKAKAMGLTVSAYVRIALKNIEVTGLTVTSTSDSHLEPGKIPEIVDNEQT